MAIEPLRHRLHQQTHTRQSRGESESETASIFWWKAGSSCHALSSREADMPGCRKKGAGKASWYQVLFLVYLKKPYHLLFLLFSSPTTRDIFFFLVLLGFIAILPALLLSLDSVLCVCLSFLYAKNQQQHDIRVPLTISMQSVVVEWLSKLLGYKFFSCALVVLCTSLFPSFFSLPLVLLIASTRIANTSENHTSHHHHNLLYITLCDTKNVSFWSLARRIGWAWRKRKKSLRKLWECFFVQFLLSFWVSLNWIHCLAGFLDYTFYTQLI